LAMTKIGRTVSALVTVVAVPLSGCGGGGRALEEVGGAAHNLEPRVEPVDTYADLFDDDLDAVADTLHAKYVREVTVSAGSYS
jgi:hypothetical protein